jgi:tetrapyrrole (corrin/porphyrin) methylase-like protein
VAGLVSAGSLTIVGLGIQLGAHLTPEARAALDRADEVLYLAADPVTSAWLERLKPNARSLHTLYGAGKDRRETYAEMVETILASVRKGGKVCVALYGHPGIFVMPSHEAIRRARLEGFEARMLPAVSAEDCLFADLGVDPGGAGCLNYEATDFLIRKRTADPSACLILWQIGFLGSIDYSPESASSHLPVLVEYLRRFYKVEQEMILYEASPHPLFDPYVRHLVLADLAGADVRSMATLYVPPAREPSNDRAMMERLGMTTDDLRR